MSSPRRLPALPAALLSLSLTAACGVTGTPTAATSSATTAPSTTAPSTSAPTTSAAPEAPAAAEQGDGFVVIPGTEVALRPPKGMEVDANLPGLARAGSRTSVVVITSQVPDGKTVAAVLDEVAAAYSGPRLAEQGMRFDAPLRISVAGHPAVASTGEQVVDGVTFGKAVVEFVAGGRLVMLVGNVEPGDPVSAADLLITLRDARWSGEVGLGIELTPAPGYQRLPRTDAIWLSLDGTDVMGVPKVVAAPITGMRTIPVDERRAVAVERFGKLPTTPTATSVTEVAIAGHSGFELIGYGLYTTWAVVLFSYDGYILICGDFDPANYPDQVPAFRAIAQSLAMT